MLKTGVKLHSLFGELEQRFPTTGTCDLKKVQAGPENCQSGIFHSALMPHGTKIVYKTGCRDMRPKRLGTTALDNVFHDALAVGMLSPSENFLGIFLFTLQFPD